MGWAHIPDMDTSTSDDSLFAGVKLQPAGKVSVWMLTDECLCRKLTKLNLTMVELYPSHSSRRPMGSSEINLSDMLSHKQRGMGYTPTNQKLTQTLYLPGTLMPQG